MAVAGNDHQFARGPGRRKSSGCRQSGGRDVPYRPVEEHEADIKDPRIQSWEMYSQQVEGMAGGKDGRRNSTPASRWTDPAEHSD